MLWLSFVYQNMQLTMWHITQQGEHKLNQIPVYSKHLNICQLIFTDKFNMNYSKKG